MILFAWMSAEPGIEYIFFYKFNNKKATIIAELHFFILLRSTFSFLLKAVFIDISCFFSSLFISKLEYSQEKLSFTSGSCKTLHDLADKI